MEGEEAEEMACVACEAPNPNAKAAEEDPYKGYKVQLTPALKTRARAESSRCAFAASAAAAGDGEGRRVGGSAGGAAGEGAGGAASGWAECTRREARVWKAATRKQAQGSSKIGS
jgi:hypothetical protein